MNQIEKVNISNNEQLAIIYITAKLYFLKVTYYSLNKCINII